MPKETIDVPPTATEVNAQADELLLSDVELEAMCDRVLANLRELPVEAEMVTRKAA